MTSFVIEGGHPIQGVITPIGNKNAALPLISACLLTDEPITLHNVPLIGDVATMFDILADLGVEIDQCGDSVTLCARNVHTTEPDADLFSEIRGSLTLMGPMLARHCRFSVNTNSGAHHQSVLYNLILEPAFTRRTGHVFFLDKIKHVLFLHTLCLSIWKELFNKRISPKGGIAFRAFDQRISKPGKMARSFPNFFGKNSRTFNLIKLIPVKNMTDSFMI